MEIAPSRVVGLGPDHDAARSAGREPASASYGRGWQMEKAEGPGLAPAGGELGHLIDICSGRQ